MNRFMLAAVAAVGIACVIYSRGGSQQAQEPTRTEDRTSNQMLMRDKLHQMNRVLEGITLGQFDKVEDASGKLGMISRATTWHIADPTPRYERLVKNFQEQATDLARHAKEQNDEAATLDLARMSITCTHCHQHMRELAGQKAK